MIKTRKHIKTHDTNICKSFKVTILNFCFDFVSRLDIGFLIVWNHGKK